jgi:hypothetical protein
MNAKHTPGPWIANIEVRWPTQIGCCPLVGNPYSIHHGHRNVAAANTAADALLIAAAPELLEFAEWVLSLKTGGMIEGRARAALAKATGEKS